MRDIISKNLVKESKHRVLLVKFVIEWVEKLQEKYP